MTDDIKDLFIIGGFIFSFITICISIGWLLGTILPVYIGLPLSIVLILLALFS